MPRSQALLILAVLLAGCTASSPTATEPAIPTAGASAGIATTAPTGAITGPVTPNQTATASRICGSPTEHVYHAYRLHLLEACKTVTGVVAGVRSEADGDYHVRLTLDPQFASMLRPANRTDEHGDLVLEPICQHKVTQADAVAPCGGGVAQVPIPPIGTHVSATGSYVLDEAHGGWAELHPLFEIHPG